MTNRQRKKLATRAALKAAAHTCFVEAGYGRTPVSAIVEQAGVAHGTFYVHFPGGKEELLRELLAGFNAELAGKLVPILTAGPQDLPETIRRAARIFLDHLRRRREFVRCYAERVAVGIGLIELRDGVNPPAVELLGSALAGAAQDAGARLDSPDLVTHGLLALWLRVGLQYLFNDRVSRKRAQDTLVALTTGALSAVLTGGLDA